MKIKWKTLLSSTLILALVGTSINLGYTTDKPIKTPQNSQPSQYSLEQAMSDNAQLSTIAFSGLAFITGSAGADTFMPPGKVADFFGFQYMRDVDTAGYGHNTTFLSRVANNVLYILNDEQKAELVKLAKEQAPLYTKIAYNRFPLMNAFRRSLEGDVPSGSTGLNIEVAGDYAASMYKTDADLSYNRAVVVGGIVNAFDAEQKAYLAKMQFNNYLSWPDVAEDETLKKSMTNTEFVAVMTYASELFSWYKGSLEADVYFCPERHGTYFGGFYMKDYPAMNNPDYFISTAITGDSGQGFLDVLNTEQRALITSIIDEQRSALNEIAEIRTTVSTELRKAMSGGTVDKAKVYALIERYGELDGQISALYASRFSAVNKTLTDDQRAALVKLRNLDVVPKGAYLFSTPVEMPKFASTDYFFGVGSMPSTAGQVAAPATFVDKGTQGTADGQPPANGQKQPPNGQKQPANGQQPPAKGQKTPANGQKQPANGQQPQNDKQKPNTKQDKQDKQGKQNVVPSQIVKNGGFDGTITLGQPTRDSITASIVTNQAQTLYIAYGTTKGKYDKKTEVITTKAQMPTVITIDGLKANSGYYYKVFFKSANETKYSSTPEYTFRTSRAAGERYSFVVQSDSHLLNKADRMLYAQSLQTMNSMKPDFLFDLGDTFLNDQVDDPQSQSYETIKKNTMEQLPYFDLVTRNAPLFLTIGNHEGEYGYFLDGTVDNLAAMSTKARTTYYPNPTPNGFYSGNTAKEAGLGLPENYYAFTWGDALYVSIDPYRHSTNDPYNDKDGWQWSLGKTQYDWFKKTLETSNAKYKFVFAHHAIGNVRGGASVAKLYEWGGYDKNGKYLFDEKRPGWGKPIQTLMKENDVTIFFQGHDHLFAREVVDGVVYQTLPKPAESIADSQSNEASYPNADKLMNSGFLKVDVSSQNVQVSYYRNYQVTTDSKAQSTGVVYSYTVDAKHNVKVLKTTKDDFTKYGSGTTEKTNTTKTPKTDTKKVTPTVSTPVKEDTANTAAVSGIILGAPTADSITAKAVANQSLGAYLEYGTAASPWTQKTVVKNYARGDVMTWQLNALKADTAYIYRLQVQETGKPATSTAQSGSFHTARATGEKFVFTVQADSHRDEASDIGIYLQTLKNVLKDKPDFHMDLGDTFMAEKLGQTEQGTLERYLSDREFFESIGNEVPLFLVNGNHEGEVGWAKQSKDVALRSWAVANRLKYFVNPETKGFYTGSLSDQGNYYAFEWGDALFIALDPFTFSTEKAQSDTDGWRYTLGSTQYEWLNKTLSESTAKAKFVFIHNLVGGYGKDARGGAEAASFYEWGGNNADGSYGFDQMRPGWRKPIHDLLKENHVTAVFHGHDHFYAKQSLDGIIYQLVPQPSHPGSDVKNVSEYSYLEGTFLPPAGHLRITVGAEQVEIAYVKSSRSAAENGTIADIYTVPLK